MDHRWLVPDFEREVGRKRKIAPDKAFSVTLDDREAI
jgi:hypothetical protein